MTTKLEIYNLALSKLSAKRVVNLSENTPSRIICDQHYDIARRATLEAKHPWSFATSAVELSAITVPAAYENFWANAYSYLESALQLIRVFQADNADTEHIVRVYEDPPTVFKQCILADMEDLYGEYILDIEETSFFSPLFIDALTANLASRIAFPLTRSASFEQLFAQKFNALISGAQTQDAAESQTSYGREDTFLAAREGWGRASYPPPQQ
jgi:hypothetical protein